MMQRFSVITLFPELIHEFTRIGMVRKACALGLADITTLNPRDYADDARRTVDDAPYGGGPGMVMQVRPLRLAIAAARAAGTDAHVIYLSPQGRRLTQRDVEALLTYHHLVLVAGRYEGVDERIIERDIDAEWSIGDYVLSGGELPAMVLIEAMTRLIPGVLGDAESAQMDSFSQHLLDYPHYTRPECIDDQPVPSVLLSGDHAAIAAWRLREAVRRTGERRPDLLREAAQDPTLAPRVRELISRSD